MGQAQTYEEIRPLIELCRNGRLFDVQAWIAAGKPINPPSANDGKGKRNPLQIAIDTGFHSLVQLLLEHGASWHEARYSPLSHALEKRRLDLVELIVKHGVDIHSASMEEVFDTWNVDIIEFFIRHGADLENGNPLAYALCSRIRIALAIFKRYCDRFASFKEQADIALRHHCKEGNLKWVSLMLWAGADPYAKGPHSPFDSADAENDSCALELAVAYGHQDILSLKKIRLDPQNPNAGDLMRAACCKDKSDFLKILLNNGFKIDALEDRGSSLIQNLLSSMSLDFNFYSRERNEKDIDTFRARESIKMIHMLARNGAKWEPRTDGDVGSARRSLIKMRSDYVVEFIWIMIEYEAAARDILEELIKTPAIRSLLARHTGRINELMGYGPVR